MFLKNYTSEVPVSKTIFNIEQVLIKCGVSGITKEYAPDASVQAVTFHIERIKGERPMTIRLPVNVERALDALWLDYVDGDKLSTDGNTIIDWQSRKRRKRGSFRDQAERTAWKIIQDWIEVQMSMIQMKQADVIEVFLPYVWDGQSTVYGRLKDGGFKALLPENTQ